MLTEPETAPTATPPPRRGLANPYVQLAINVLLVAAGQLLLKRGASATAMLPVPAWLGWLGVTAVGSWWTWAAIACHLAGFVVWLQVLRSLPLSIAFPLASVVHALVPLGAWLFLGESISYQRWSGIAVIITGLWLIAQPLAQAEEVL